jgi:hypothetical protein
MDSAEAKAVLLRHQGGEPEEDTILGWLRPYRGVNDRHLAEILHALLVAAPCLNGPTEIDRGLVHAIWELCRTVRAWTQGPREPMFHGLRFISPAEKRRLDSWTDQVESITLLLLRGRAISMAFFGLPWYVVEWGLGPHAAFLAPLFTEMLQELGEEESNDDDKINLCRALASMGSAARGAAAVIHTVGERATHSEVKGAAAEALRAIT